MTLSEAAGRPAPVTGGPDPHRRRRAKRSGRETGCWTYIDAAELERAGLEPGADAPYYRTHGFRRSRNGHTVIVSLYREP